jgi:cytoskeletal protein RodZ
MPTVGEQLRQAREARNLTVNQVADTTKIRTDHIRALESGHYDVFSASVYIRGFVRTYAALMKLDVAAVMAALDRELSQSDKHREPPPLGDQPRNPIDFLTLQLSKINWRVALPALAVVLSVMILLGSWRAWRSYRDTDPLARLGPGLYQATNEVSGDLLPLPGPPAPKR